MPAVDGVSFEMRAGETLAIVGESGSGKSVTALSILRLIPPEIGRVVAGSVRFAGRNLLDLGERGMRRLRGNEISMIFQEPMTALNPVHTIGRQLGESLRLHQGLRGREARRRAVELLDMVRLSEAARRVDQYPHELSGGMRQRVMIAMALACRPKLLIADEPTTALDVTIQAQILDLMRELVEANDTTVLLITHDLGVVAEMANRVLVMYAGRIVEESTVEAIFRRPGHPYTRALLASMPRLGSSLREDPPGRLLELPGSIPALSADRAPGCAFAPRCVFATDRCRREEPPLVEHAAGSRSACFEWEKVCGP
ncbi:ABC transporter ATP-binding protein [Castellaniella sp. GW247-6E4]|uniref:ABC transporter ATP-binding protein n=1 Tax=Castellaniella sp. GW247-6E4 TaxID=3140380 RepID=UPI003314B94F